jgi:hypothetical protein
MRLLWTSWLVPLAPRRPVGPIRFAAELVSVNGGGVESATIQPRPAAHVELGTFDPRGPVVRPYPGLARRRKVEVTATRKRVNGMRRQPWWLYAVALAILAVGLVALGVPASTLLVGAFVVACPLMMMLMMGGMHSGNTASRPSADHRHPTPEDHDQPTGGRRQVETAPWLGEPR